MEGVATPELLKQYPPVFSNSLRVCDELIEDPFASGQGAAYQLHKLAARYGARKHEEN
jgi:hypothetical protein